MHLRRNFPVHGAFCARFGTSDSGSRQTMKPGVLDPGRKATGSHFPPKPASPHPSCLQWLESKLFAWLPAISFAFMIYSSITAIYRSKGDPGTVAFVAGSLSILSGLYWCMSEFERAVSQGATAKKERLKLAIWVLAMALNTLFSYRVTTVMESTVLSLLVWAVAGVTMALGCFLMFYKQGADGAPL